MVTPQIVVDRFLERTGGAVDPHLKAFKKAQLVIERAIQSGEVSKARQAFIALGKQLEPLAAILDNVRLQRSDEKRKLKNVQERLHKIKYPFEAKFLNDTDEEVAAWIKLSLNTIEEALISLRKMQNRLEEYTQIQKQFKHGPFTIVNSYGYRESEYTDPLQLLDTVSEKIKAKGFSKVLYGKVVLTAKGNWAGKYDASSDTLFLNVEARKRFHALHTLVHELGHRWWHQMVSSSQQSQYEDLYAGKRGIDLKSREAMFQALVQAEFSPRKAAKLLDSSLQEAFQQWHSFVFGGHSQKYLLQAHTSGEKWVEKNFVRPKQRYVYTENSSVVTVSDYAKTNVFEDFAETFAFYVLNKPIPEQVYDRFNLTL